MLEVNYVNAKTFGAGALALGKMLAGLLILATSPLLGNVYKKANEDFSGQSKSEEAEKMQLRREIAVTAALIDEAKNFLSGNPETNSKRAEFFEE